MHLIPLFARVVARLGRVLVYRFAMSTGLLIAGQAALAAELLMPALPPALQQAQPVSLLPPDVAQAFVFRDGLNSKEAPGSFKRQRELLGKPVFVAENRKGSSNYDGINVHWKSPHAVKKGDVLFARFAARALKARQESGEAEGMFYFRRFEGGSGRAVQAFSVGPDWTVINVPLVVLDDAAAGEAATYISYGNLEQTLEIAGLEIYSFGNRLKLADLPITRFNYFGRETDAAWRREALARIEKIRTAPLTIKVVDASGKPVVGAAVEATLTQSAFLWGTAVDAGRLIEKSADAERYRKAVVELFDTAVIENGLKWPSWRKPAGRAQALEALDWLLAQGLRAKGHNLVWPAWKFSPEDIASDPERGSKISGLVDAHIRDITEATKGKLIGWDVVNEPVHETDYFKHMPREQVAHWFKLAEASDPKLQLTLNEYSMLNRSSSPLFIQEFLEFSRMLRKNGARVDVLGVQGHIGQTPRPPVEVLNDLNLLATDGQQVQVTEFDFNTTDEQLQADYTRDFLIALYSHKAASGFVMWGFWESAQWKPNAAMYRADWSAKPNLQVWKDLVLGQWKTRVSAQTTALGLVQAQGHRGRYAVTAKRGAQHAKATVELGEGGTELVLKLE